MKKGLGIMTFLGCLLLITSFSTHSFAAFEDKDDPYYGPASIIYDPSTGLEWLKLTFSVNRTYNDVSTQFGTGGDFEGFRHATIEEVLGFISEAGITIIDTGVSDPNIVTIYQNFAELVAPTILYTGYPAAFGVTGTQFGLESRGAVLIYGYPLGSVCYIAQVGSFCPDTDTFPQLGHWLVRLPELDSNQLPVANDDSATTQPNLLVNINVVENDNDPDGNGSLNLLTGVTLLGMFKDAGGEVHYNGGGTFIYTPAPGFIGEDSFDYQICDNGRPVLCDTATVTVEVGTRVSFSVIPQKLNVMKKGVIPVAILSTRELNVTTIDPGSVLLEGYPPVHWNVAGRSKRLNLKFNAQDIVEAIGTGNVNDGDVVTLHLTGYLYDDPNDTLVGGEAIFGEDAVLIIGKPKPKHPEE